jgi:trans-2,3-dihydro-3-hydroxyanthranilate isomerase
VQYKYYLVDVFTQQAFSGAQIAVFPEAEGLSDAQMQSLAKELSLTESVFLFASAMEDCFKLKIFSPSGERNFSGHATIASGFVLAKTGKTGFGKPHKTLIFEQNTGPLEVIITMQAEQIFVQFSRAAEVISDRFVPTNAQLAEMLSLDEKELNHARYNTLLVSCEKPYLVIPVSSFEAVRRAVFQPREWSTSIAPIVAADEFLVFSAKSDITQSNFHGRLVGPQIGPDEDPPIASAMPAFAGYLAAHDHVKQGTYSFSIDRGTVQTRKSVLAVEFVTQKDRQNQIRVGGPAVLVAEGSIIAPN